MSHLCVHKIIHNADDLIPQIFSIEKSIIFTVLNYFFFFFGVFPYLGCRYVCALETIPDESEEEENEEGNNNETELTRLSHHSAVGHSPEETETDAAELHDCTYLQIRDGSKGKSEF